MLPCRGVISRERGCEMGPLTLPFISRRMRLPESRETLEPLLPPPRQRGRLGSPKRLPPTSALERARHRTRGLAAAESASGALSPFRCFRTKKLDLRRVRKLFTCGRAGRTPLVDFCNRNNPRPQPFESTKPRAPRFWSPKSTAQLWRVAALLAKRCQPRCHGSGACPGIHQASSLHPDRS
jgi:hypothetical protein